MIPQFDLPSLHLFGPFAIQPFGSLVAFGVFLGMIRAQNRAESLGIKKQNIESGIRWVLIPGFIGAHVFEMFFYQWDRLIMEGPVALLKLWDGISSFGGIFGAAFGFFWISRSYRSERRAIMDLLVEGFVIGWVFGRIGCSLVVDHPGSETDFALGFMTRDGVRHNLGFYELIYTILVLFPVSRWMSAKVLKQPGMLTVLMCLLYAPVRFVLDFFRSTDQVNSDPRFLGLTAGHYSAVVLVGIGVYLWWTRPAPVAKADLI